MQSKLKLWSVALSVLFLALPSAALAFECDQMVVDEAGVFGAKAASVEAAAQELVSAGAEVRVIVIRTFGSAGNLDNYEANVERSCRSWQAPDGGTKNNLIVLMVAISDRKTGLYYGSLWKRNLESRWTAIQTDEMNPRFRDGDFAGGIAAGLKEITAVVTAKTHEYAQPLPREYPQPVERPAPQAAPTVIQTQPTDYTGLWIVLGSVVGLAALVLLVVFAVRLARARARRLAAQQKAKQLKNACSAQIGELTEALPLLDSKVKCVVKDVSAEDGQPLTEQQAQLNRDFDNATARFADLQNSAGDPDRDGKSYEEYAQMQGAYQEVLDKLHAVREGSGQLAAGVSSLKKAVDGAPAAAASAEAGIAAAEAAAVEVENQGYKTGEVRDEIGESRKSLDAAKAHLAEKGFTAAVSACGEADRASANAKKTAESLPRRKADLDEAIAALKTRLPGVTTSIDQAGKVFGEISENYAESCWETVRGNGTEAENRETFAANAIQEAAKAAAMDCQDWKRGEEIVASANQALDEALSLMRSIAALKTNLEAAKRDAPAEIESAQADIDRAAAYEREFDDDIDDAVKADIRRDRELLDQAKAELAKAKPDYLMVVRIAKEANSAADKILDRCQSEHEAMERKRQRAASAVRDAKAAISKAQEYMEDHASDIGIALNSTSHLDDAKRCLSQALNTEDLDARIRLAEQADSAAGSALSSAKHAVSAAEAERRRARERAAAALAASISASTRSSSSGGFGGSTGWGTSSSHRSGGSTGWGGSSGSSGGGSSGWGGSSRGGGSTGW